MQAAAKSCSKGAPEVPVLKWNHMSQKFHIPDSVPGDIKLELYSSTAKGFSKGAPQVLDHPVLKWIQTS